MSFIISLKKYVSNSKLVYERIFVMFYVFMYNITYNKIKWFVPLSVTADSECRISSAWSREFKVGGSMKSNFGKSFIPIA